MYIEENKFEHMSANDAYGVCQLQPVSQARETAQHTLGQDPVYEVIRETDNDSLELWMVARMSGESWLAMKDL